MKNKPSKSATEAQSTPSRKHFKVLITASQIILVKNAGSELEALELANENFQNHEFEYDEGSIESEVTDLAMAERQAKQWHNRVVDALEC